MKFRTEISLKPSAHFIHHQQHVLAMGSCFAERMGARLLHNKFSATINPLGIAYHPMALLHHLRIAQGKAEVAAPMERDGLWHSFDLHSSFSNLDKDSFAEAVKNAALASQKGLKQAEWLILTFGSAWGYRRKDTQALVTNCHKYPADFFQKELLPIEELVAGFSAFFQELPPHQQVILTVSPVRHLKDGIPENAVSKATLRLACHQLAEAFEQVQYFPAYEMLVDDLRDYRFYADDLAHPSSAAEAYIWEGFAKSFFSPDTQALITRWQKLQKALKHRPLQPQSSGYQTFLKKLLKDLETIQQAIPCEKEIMEVKRRLTEISE